MSKTEFQEYPKAVYLDGDITGETLIVNSAEEEATAKQGGYGAPGEGKKAKKG